MGRLGRYHGDPENRVGGDDTRNDYKRNQETYARQINRNGFWALGSLWTIPEAACST